MGAALATIARDVCGSEAVTIDDGRVIGGVDVALTVAPSSTSQLAALLRRTGPDATVVVTGNGTKLHIGLAPERVDLLVSTARLDQVVQHEPGDLVVRVEAGARLSMLQAVVAPHGQQLALESSQAEATIGGVVAANESGPRRHRYGSARDVVIGATMVLADGTVARTGGKVVKNVAGYDLGKLMVGSYGTLAILTEVTFRLHPTHPCRRVVVTPIARSALAALVARHRTSALEPTVLELVMDLPGEDGHLVVGFEGSAPSVEAQAALAVRFDAGARVVEEVPAGLDVVERAVSLRIVVEPAATIVALDALARCGVVGRVCCRVALGIIDAQLEPDALDAVVGLRAELARFDGSVVVTRLPVARLPGFDVWGPVAAPTLQLMRSVKHRFDPDRRLAPGRFVGGI